MISLTQTLKQFACFYMSLAAVGVISVFYYEGRDLL